MFNSSIFNICFCMVYLIYLFYVCDISTFGSFLTICCCFFGFFFRKSYLAFILQTNIVKKWGLKFWTSSESKHQKSLCISVLQPCIESEGIQECQWRPCITVSINVSPLSLNIDNDVCDNLFTRQFDLWNNILYRHESSAQDWKKGWSLNCFHGA